MKKVEAVIPHARMQSAFSTLRQLDLGGLTYYDSKGRGQIPTPVIHAGRGTSVYRPEFNVNVTISIVVKDSIVDKVVGKILDSTSTGLAGEGKIFVSEIDDAVDIGSRERGDAAI
ncbi:MAG: P-II family nitrogen regulator [Thermoproteota archaeon]|nr:P-II family nitrogen regulator [Thermoproteota archaeon]